MLDNTIHKYQLVRVVKDDEFILDEWDMDILLVNPKIIVNGSYYRMCQSDREESIVELREMIDEDNYNVLASMNYEKELKEWEMLYELEV